MADTSIGLMSPGEMGAAVAASLVGAGRRVLSVLDGRSSQSLARAQAAGIAEAADVDTLVSVSALVVSIVPPAAALEVASVLAQACQRTGAHPLVVEANAVSPARAGEMARLLDEAGAGFVDGDLIGGPPGPGRPATRLYLSGTDAEPAAAALATPEVRPVVLPGPPMAASALKMAYAAWTKGSAALLLTARALARELGVEEALLAEWAQSQPDLAARCEAAARGAGRAWRFVGEMDEVASAHERAGLPKGFAQAAADAYGRLASLKGRVEIPVTEVLDLLTTR